MNKYIVRNCPCYAKGIFCKGGDIIDGGCADYTLDKDSLICCADCTDCLLKQIVELCKQRIVKYQNKDFFKYEDARILNGEAIMSVLILELLDIEECE